MNLLVIGGRDFNDVALLEATLDREHESRKFTLVIHGAASGADRLAGEWALKREVPISARPAEWKKFGRAAGPIRNQEMLDEKPDLVIAFPGGKGTADMVRRAKKAGLKVIVVEASA